MKPNWKNIHWDFTPKLVKEWQAQGFTYEQTADWINIGLQPTDVFYTSWLRDIKNKDSEWVLNHGNQVSLKREYKLYQINYLNNLNPPHHNPHKPFSTTTKLLMIGSLTLLTIYLLTKNYDF